MPELYPLHLLNKKPNFYGFSGLDRSAHIRQDEGWLKILEKQGNAKVVFSWRSQSMVNLDKPGEPYATILALSVVSEIVNKADNVVFLGEKSGISYLGIDLSSIEEDRLDELIPSVGVFTDLRQVGPLLERFEGSLLAYNRALLFWHQKNKFC